MIEWGKNGLCNGCLYCVHGVWDYREDVGFCLMGMIEGEISDPDYEATRFCKVYEDENDLEGD
jgi:peptide methionine sulfoxide reductase MsrA